MMRDKDDGKVLQRVVRGPALQKDLDNTLNRRVMPELRKAFSTTVTRREEYSIAGYDAAEEGGLGAHHDNPTKETRHRRFTISVTLDASAFKGRAFKWGAFKGAPCASTSTAAKAIWSPPEPPSLGPVPCCTRCCR